MSSNSPYKYCIYLHVKSGWKKRNFSSLSSFSSTSIDQNLVWTMKSSSCILVIIFSKLLETRTQFVYHSFQFLRLWKILYNILWNFAFLIKNNYPQEAICNWYLLEKSIFSSGVSLALSPTIQSDICPG